MKNRHGDQRGLSSRSALSDNCTRSAGLIMTTGGPSSPGSVDMRLEGQVRVDGGHNSIRFRRESVPRVGVDEGAFAPMGTRRARPAKEFLVRRKRFLVAAESALRPGRLSDRSCRIASRLAPIPWLLVELVRTLHFTTASKLWTRHTAERVAWPQMSGVVVLSRSYAL